MSPFEPERSRQQAIDAVRCRGSAEIPESPFANVLAGIVMGRTEGLTRTTLRIRVGQHTNLRVRWPASSPAYDAVQIGHTVRLSIPEEAVQLEAGGFRRGKRRWNRWIGLVVLVDRQSGEPVTTVKIHHDHITLRSRGPIIGAQTPLSTWDTVNVVVDPQRLYLTPLIPPTPAIGDPDIYRIGPSPASVWIQATIRSIRPTPIGAHVALNVGGVDFAALIETNGLPEPAWSVGSSVQITINQSDGWIRQSADSPVFPCCVLLSSEVGDPSPTEKLNRHGQTF